MNKHMVISPNRENRTFQVIVSFLTQINLFTESAFYQSDILGVEHLKTLALSFVSFFSIFVYD